MTAVTFTNFLIILYVFYISEAIRLNMRVTLQGTADIGLRASCSGIASITTTKKPTSLSAYKAESTFIMTYILLVYYNTLHVLMLKYNHQSKSKDWLLRAIVKHKKFLGSYTVLSVPLKIVIENKERTSWTEEITK